jgi:integrase
VTSKWVKAHLARDFVTEVGREDILRLLTRGRDEGLNAKTVTRRLLAALMALRNSGAVINLKKGDWPKLTDKSVEIYDKHALEKFFDTCERRERLLFQTFLCTGFRKREVNTRTWDAVNFPEHTILVQPKLQYRFKPKNHEERAVSVPGLLIRALSVWKRTHHESALIFATLLHPKRPNYGGEKPDEHHLELCKQIAWRARLNCGCCMTRTRSCKKGHIARNGACISGAIRIQPTCCDPT